MSYSHSMPGLKNAAQSRLKCPPILLSLPQATRLLQQFHETAEYRDWQNLAVAIMRTHIHLLVNVAGDPEPDKILQDFKAYGSRALNAQWTKPASGMWWTESGSKRKKASYQAILNAVRYVANQDNPLVLWIHPEWQSVLEASEIARGSRLPLASPASGGRKSPA
jgi:REP element-mobilizing transposase RayT